MGFDIVRFDSINQIVDLCLAIALLAGLILLAIKLKVTLVTLILMLGLSLAYILCWFLNLNLSSYIVFSIIVTMLFVVCLLHSGAIRTHFSRFSKSPIGKNTAKFDKIIDHEKLYNEIYECVLRCSRQKIGALITFEKHDNLNNLTKNGTVINAPVTHELLMTIFYPGTRLHDGAVIIRGNTIYAASVYYTPTTKALSGKYGSRHRAAIGISEISDSVTVVVSEETGRISIAHSGELESVEIDNFIEKLTEHMNQGE